MKRKLGNWKGKAAAAAAAVCLVAGLAGPAQAKGEKVLLKVPCSIAFGVPIVGKDTIAFIADRINQAGDRVKMTIYEPGKLVPPFEVLDAVSSGKVNAGYTSAFYFAGKAPAGVLFSSYPFGPEADEYLAWFHFGNGKKLFQEMYDHYGYNVKVIPATMISAETSGWFAKPITKPEDLKGLKMRISGVAGSVMAKLGVAITMLPAGEIFQALEKGLIDATEFSLPVCDLPLGFYKVAKYNYYPGWHQPSTSLELLINKDVWNNLDAAQQSLIDTACMAGTLYSLARAEGQQGKVIRENAEKHGVKNMYWSPEMLDAFKRAWGEVAQEECQKDAFFKKCGRTSRPSGPTTPPGRRWAFLPRPKPPEVK